MTQNQLKQTKEAKRLEAAMATAKSRWQNAAFTYRAFLEQSWTNHRADEAKADKDRFVIDVARISEMRKRGATWLECAQSMQVSDQSVRFRNVKHAVQFGHSIADDFVTANEKTELNRFHFSVRLSNVLRNANLITVGDVLSKSYQEMLKYRNCGRLCLFELHAILARHGIEWPRI